MFASFRSAALTSVNVTMAFSLEAVWMMLEMQPKCLSQLLLPCRPGKKFTLTTLAWRRSWLTIVTFWKWVPLSHQTWTRLVLSFMISISQNFFNTRCVTAASWLVCGIKKSTKRASTLSLLLCLEWMQNPRQLYFPCS